MTSYSVIKIISEITRVQVKLLLHTHVNMINSMKTKVNFSNIFKKKKINGYKTFIKLNKIQRENEMNFSLD